MECEIALGYSGWNLIWELLEGRWRWADLICFELEFEVVS